MIPHAERLQRPKAWFRVWAQHTIKGTTFQELGAGPRAVWFSLLCFACESREPGIIGLGSPVTIGYTMAQLAAKMCLDIGEVEAGIKRLIEVKKITVNDPGVIEVINWKTYQSPMDASEKMRRYRGNKEGNINSNKAGNKKSNKNGLPEVKRLRGLEVKRLRDKESEKEKSEKPPVAQYVWGEFGKVRLTADQHYELGTRLGVDVRDHLIEELDGAVEAKGYKYKSAFATILSWARRKKEKNPFKKQEPKGLDAIKELRQEEGRNPGEAQNGLENV